MTSSDTPRMIRVFIASPGDLAVERRAFKEVIDELNDGFGDGAGVRFEAVGWEDTLATTGRRSQGVINKEVDRCDIFVLAMHRRWGQKAPDAEPYSSYTEEEFYRAYNLWKTKPKNGKDRRPEIFVFFKHIDPGQMADPGEQLQKVLEFRKQLEDSREVLYHGFEDEVEFRREIDRHLRAFAKGELPKADAIRSRVLLPFGVLEEIRKEREETDRALKLAEVEHKVAEAAVARAEALALEFAERAAKAALEGRVEEARQDLAKAAEGTTNLRVLYLAFEFYKRTGDLAAAEETLERWLAISGPDSETVNTASAFGNLGLIYMTRGDLEKAEEMQKRSLTIDEKLANQDGIARSYGNLGLIYDSRGELDKAEIMLKKALAVNEELGRQEGVAKQYGNLAVVYQRRRELSRAEEMLEKSLVIHEKLGHQEGMAIQFGNLGLLYEVRGDLDMAEEMLNKSLAIDEKLGRQEGMANQYGNLANVYNSRGDLDKAEEMHRKALTIDEKLGNQEGMSSDYGGLGLIHQTRGELEKAEDMYKKAIAIVEKCAHQEGIAIQYKNFGSLAKQRGDLKTAREFWTKSRDLFKKIGIPHEVAETGCLLDGLPRDE